MPSGQGNTQEYGECFAVRVAAGGVGPAAFGEDVHVAGELVLQEGSGVNAGGFEDEGVVFSCFVPRGWMRGGVSPCFSVR